MRRITGLAIAAAIAVVSCGGDDSSDSAQLPTGSSVQDCADVFAEGVITDIEAMSLASAPCIDDSGDEVIVSLGGWECHDGRDYRAASEDLGWGYDGEPWNAGPPPDHVVEECLHGGDGDDESDADPAPMDTPGSREAPLDIGQQGAVGEWQVTITEVTLDATAEVEAENQFNGPPTNGQYMRMSVETTYRGQTEGTPRLDLDVTLIGGDAVQYERCDAVVGGSDFTTVESGGTVTLDLCLDVPAEAIDGGLLFVEPLFSFEGADRTYWSLT